MTMKIIVINIGTLFALLCAILVCTKAHRLVVRSSLDPFVGGVC